MKMKSQTKKFQPIYRGLVVFDLDGVLADFEGAFCEAFGYDNRELYSLEGRYPDQADTVSEWCREPENYVDLMPIFGGLLYLRQALEAGFYVVVMTARDPKLRTVTELWMNRYNIRPHSLEFSADKLQTTFTMSETLGLRLIMFVDDSIRNLKEIASVYPEEITLAWEQPWNAGWYPRAWYDPDRLAVIVEK